uniref:Mitogen-activated protein kinase n=1 Tax=Lotharella globosa TaxID=91324 RepID=A0A6V3SC04_9EUKA|mmetsp:Transcript_22674/g.45585  ORF Transcript_22674/g.45585 Transcript_22674/m.45585 type:complete len:396 (+) Transcript_22674:202-1389(+)|eukprot:CAMPEP_0167831388 /NCGR_PEP_ID=MMETSP0112_2-20121227/13596_1 /TAXON_ID=91324 /ORGANISM="Lotharella globosa, Strain CCCM811" /LENGTH=395 /DNA_ID=CAMNT_0007736005 /DNA_START=171 /DNA_END=1358 /DNA_ORIENTATION=-
MSEEIDKHILRKYEVLKRVGKGAYGIVWKATDRKSRRTVALKKIFDAFQNSTDAQRTFREIMFLQELNMTHHPNIIRLLNVLKADNDRDIYLVFEYMEINLHAVIRANILEQVHKKYILYQIIKALKFLHSGELIHRDMKPSNVLLNSDCHCKLIDFGLARSCANIDVDNSNVVLTDYVATRWYRAPEILLGSTKYTKSVDMWSIGCILGELVGGHPMFPGDSTINQLEKVITVTGFPSKGDMAAIRSRYTTSMLENINIKERKSLRSMYPNACSDALDLLNKLLQFNPEKRISSTDALKHPYLKQFCNPEEEMVMTSPIKISIDDNVRFSISEYRKSLYRQIVAKRKEQRKKKAAAKARSKRSSTRSRGPTRPSTRAGVTSSHGELKSSYKKSS